MEGLLDSLNAEQKKAVIHEDGPLLVLAGAGTGKTTVLTRRIAWLILSGKAKSSQVAALTFTEKAAREMEERLDVLLPYGVVDVTVSTFHGFAEKLLREFAAEIGLPTGAKLFDEMAAYLLFRRHWDDLKLDYYAARGNPAHAIQNFLQHFSRCKDEGITPAAYAEAAAQEEDADERARLQELARAYAFYQDLLLAEGGMDFGDMLMHVHALLTERPRVRQVLRERYRYLLVDEFQDTNSIQYRILKLLLPTTGNLNVVGDDDQSIYRFRGAALDNILQFVDDFPETAVVTLTQNYRSKQEVLDVAYQFIQQNNPRRLEARLQGDARWQVNKRLTGGGTGGFVQAQHFGTEEAEARWIVERMTALKAEDPALSWNDFCVLVRANDHALPVIQYLERQGIPYYYPALGGLYAQGLVLDVLSYLRAAVFPHDSVPLSRVLTSFIVGLSEQDLFTLLYEARKHGDKTLFAVLGMAQQIPELSAEGKQKVADFLQRFEKAGFAARAKHCEEAFLTCLHAARVIEHINEKSPGEKAFFFNLLQQLHARVKRWQKSARDPRLSVFLEDVDREIEAGESGALRQDEQSGPEYVRVLTVHASKGLEFAYVFVPRLVHLAFPAVRRSEGIPLPAALVPPPSDEERAALHTEEERRLMYVALTRAKRGVYLCHADDYGGKQIKKPSTFLKEMGLVSAQAQLNTKDVQPTLFSQYAEKLEPQFQHALQPSKRLSFTQLQAFSSCPLQYKFAHLYRIPLLGSYIKSYGQTLHAVFQRTMETVMTKPGAKKFPVTAAEMQAMLDEVWTTLWYPSPQVAEEHYAKACESVKLMRALFVKEKARPVLIEAPFKLKLGEWTVEGKIDRVDVLPDGTHVVIDYKTGTPKEAEEIDFKRRMQLILYGVALETCFGLKVSALRFVYVDNASVQEFPFTAKEAEKLQSQLLETAQTLRDSTFLATPGRHCAWCDFQRICEFRVQ